MSKRLVYLQLVHMYTNESDGLQWLVLDEGREIQDYLYVPDEWVVNVLDDLSEEEWHSLNVRIAKAFAGIVDEIPADLNEDDEQPTPPTSMIRATKSREVSEVV